LEDRRILYYKIIQRYGRTSENKTQINRKLEETKILERNKDDVDLTHIRVYSFKIDDATDNCKREK
jgi:hypothetical protein